MSYSQKKSRKPLPVHFSGVSMLFYILLLEFTGGKYERAGELLWVQSIKSLQCVTRFAITTANVWCKHILKESNRPSFWRDCRWHYARADVITHWSVQCMSHQTSGDARISKWEDNRELRCRATIGGACLGNLGSCELVCGDARLRRLLGIFLIRLIPHCCAQENDRVISLVMSSIGCDIPLDFRSPPKTSSTPRHITEYRM